MEQQKRSDKLFNVPGAAITEAQRSAKTAWVCRSGWRTCYVVSRSYRGAIALAAESFGVTAEALPNQLTPGEVILTAAKDLRDNDAEEFERLVRMLEAMPPKPKPPTDPEVYLRD